MYGNEEESDGDVALCFLPKSRCLTVCIDYIKAKDDAESVSGRLCGKEYRNAVR